MRKIFTISILALSLLSVNSLPVSADTGVITQYVPNAQKIGEDRLSYLFWDIYDASLYSPNGIFSQSKPFALKLDYLRWLKGIRIAERSAKEIKEQGFDDNEKLNNWLDQMIDIFPDVDDGDTITGIRDKNGYAVFYLNDERIGEVKDKEFTQKFFDIWLSTETSEPDMRKELLGL